MGDTPSKVLIPRIPAKAVERPRLLDYVHESLNKRLFTALAPAGYGKTTLFAQFAHDVLLPVCWYTLDPSDSEPSRFLTNLVASFRMQLPNFGRRLRLGASLPSAPSTDDLNSAVSAIGDELRRQADSLVVLVLDDLFRVNEAPQVNDLVYRLIKHGPTNLRVMVLSRNWPPFPTGSLSAAGQIAGVNIDDLRFTPEESAQLQTQHVQGRGSRASIAASRGWAAALALGADCDHQILTIAGDVAVDTFDLLAESVFARLPDDLRHFLFLAAIPATADSDVLAALGVSEGIERLASLDSHRFLICELATGRFRLHDLFRAYLQQRFRQSDPSAYLKASRAYARFLFRRRQHAAAIRLLIELGDIGGASKLTARHGPTLLASGQFRTLDGLLNSLPAHALEASAELQLLAGRLALAHKDWSRANRFLTRVAKASAPHSPRAAVQLSLSQAELALARTHPTRARRLALEVLRSQTAGRRERAEARKIIALSLLDKARHTEAPSELEQAEQELRAVGNHASAARLSMARAQLLRRLGKIEEASHLLLRLEAYFAGNGAKGSRAEALAQLGRTRHFAGEIRCAAETLQHSIDLAGEAGHTAVKVVATKWLGDVFLDLGEPTIAIHLYHNALSEATDPRARLIILVALANTCRLARDDVQLQRVITLAGEAARKIRSKFLKAALLLARGAANLSDYERAQPDIEKARKAFSGLHATRLEVHARYLESLAAFHARRVQESDAHLARCLTLAQTLPSTEFLVAEGRASLPFLQQAALRHDQCQLLTSLIERAASGSTAGEALRSLGIHESVSTRVHVRALGNFGVTRDGQRLNPTRLPRFAREVLVQLGARASASADDILESVFGHLHYGPAVSSLYNALYQIERLLGPGSVAVSDGAFRLAAQLDLRVDAVEFRRRIAAGESERALRLYRGPFLPESTATWATLERCDLAAVLARAAIDAATSELTSGDSQAAEATISLALRNVEAVLPRDAPAVHALHEFLSRLNRPASASHRRTA